MITPNDVDRAISVVAAKAGIAPPKWFASLELGSPAAANSDDATILVNPRELQAFSVPELEAILAHEFGHLVLKHGSPDGLSSHELHSNELAADQFAKSIGYGHTLADVFKRFHKLTGGRMDRGNKTHPSMSVRIKALEANLEARA